MSGWAGLLSTTARVSLLLLLGSLLFSCSSLSHRVTVSFGRSCLININLLKTCMLYAFKEMPIVLQETSFSCLSDEDKANEE